MNDVTQVGVGGCHFCDAMYEGLNSHFRVTKGRGGVIKSPNLRDVISG